MRIKHAIFGTRAVLACAFLSSALFAQTTITYSYAGLPVAIYGDGANVISVVGVTIPRALTITKVTAQVQIQYPNTGDLKVYLFSPLGTRAILLEHDCGIQNIDTTFDDAAPEAWKDFCPAEAGRGPYRADQPLSNFNGDSSSFGLWSLWVENDTSDSRSGWITGFSLTITGITQLNPVTTSKGVINYASLEGAGTVAPGEVVSILGVGLGPNPPVTAGSGAIPTSLGGSSVLFNGVAAPILYASQFRVNAQVPFGVVPGTTASIQVNSSTGLGSPITASVVDVVPGLYTAGIGGAGALNVINSDGSTKPVIHPAPKGSYVILYGNGLGAMNPPLTAGAVPPASPLSWVSGTVTATMGGQPATVLYAGSAPGLPGLYQINLSVPTAVLSGQRDVVVYVNGKGSQANATIQIQ